MEDIQIGIAAITSVILFIFGLEHFSKEIQKITGERFRQVLGRFTRIPIVGVGIGAVITAIIQSSSATSVIAISLVNAGILSFKNSVGIILGANVGTTVTAQLVAFKLTAFAPAFIILGFLISFIRSRYSFVAKSLFYFGFVFFSLNLISSTLEPLQGDPRILELLSGSHHPFWGILIGCLITAVVQSSSVTTGLAVIFTQQGLMSLDNAVPILMGANLGTTVTALLAIINTDIAAKKTALAHIMFNIAGVILFLPFLFFAKDSINYLGDEPAIALANFHFVFNIITCLVFLSILKPFTSLVEKILGEGKMDFKRLELDFIKKGESYAEVKVLLLLNLKNVFSFVQENYNQVSLSIETNYKNVYEASSKRIEYIDFLENEFLNFFSDLVNRTTDEIELEELIKIIGVYEYIFQIHDSIKDIAEMRESMGKKFIELKSDLLILVRELSSHALSLFDHISKHTEKDDIDEKELKRVGSDVQRHINKFNREILVMLGKSNREDAGAILHMITYTQRLKDKLINYHHQLSKFFEMETVVVPSDEIQQQPDTSK